MAFPGPSVVSRLPLRTRTVVALVVGWSALLPLMRSANSRPYAMHLPISTPCVVSLIPPSPSRPRKSVVDIPSVRPPMRTTCDRREIDNRNRNILASTFQAPESHQGQIVTLITRPEPANFVHALLEQDG